VATNFPSSLDALTNPTGSDTLASPDHAGQHADSNDAIEALQAKVGVDSSAVTSSLDYKVAQKVDKSLVDAKGDLIVASANDAVARLPVGATNGHVLTVDSAETLGVKWAAASGGGVDVSDTAPVSPSANDVWFNSSDGRSYIYYNDGNTTQWVEFGNANVGPTGATGATGATGDTGPGMPIAFRASTLSLPGVILTAETTGQSLSAQRVLYFPIVVLTTITMTQVSANVTTQSSTAGCKSRIAIYNADASWVPTTLVLDCGEIACDSTGAKTLSISQSLPPGRYFIRLHGDNSASRPSFYTYRGSPLTGTMLGTNTQFVYQITKSPQTYAVAEATVESGDLPATGGTSSSPFLYFVRTIWS
jgi:hypothetical protein